MSFDYKFIFIGGAGRSGTTLLQKMLCKHNAIAGGAEFYHSRDIFELYNKFKVHETSLQSFIGASSLEFRFRSFYQSFFSEFLVDSNVVYISEKTPTNIEVAETMLSLYPNAFFIYVYRDGRDVVNSHLNVKKRAWKRGVNLTEVNLIRTALYWRNCQALAFRAKQKYSDRFIEIKYEKLVSELPQTLNQIFKQLQLQEEGKRISTAENAQEDSDVHINNIWYTQEMYHQKVGSANINKWKKELHFFQRIILQTLLFDVLKSLGYKVNSIYQLPNKMAIWLLNWRNEIKRIKIFEPFIQLKRRLQ